MLRYLTTGMSDTTMSFDKNETIGRKEKAIDKYWIRFLFRLYTGYVCKYK